MCALYLSLFSLVSIMNLSSPTGRNKPVRSLCQQTLAQIIEQRLWDGITQERELSYPIEIQLLVLVKHSTLRWGIVPSYLSEREAMHWGRKIFPRHISRNKCFWRWLHHSNSGSLSAYFISCSQAYGLQLDGLWSFWEMCLGFISSQFESCNHELLHSHLYVHYTAVKANCSGFGFYYDLIWFDLTCTDFPDLCAREESEAGRSGGSFHRDGANG